MCVYMFYVFCEICICVCFRAYAGAYVSVNVYEILDGGAKCFFVCICVVRNYVFAAYVHPNSKESKKICSVT